MHGDRVVSLRGNNDEEPGRSPCGRHLGLWIAALGALGSAAVTLVVVGAFVGGLRSDLTSLNQEWQRDRASIFTSQQQVSTALSAVQSAMSAMKDAISNLKANLAEERQERLDDERRLLQMETVKR
ncbi:MAG: hypothetical protein KGO96_10570 [Elusimicrobia bacterium]|nr:hypothetical protein [Elusimicrobiota bacterium]